MEQLNDQSRLLQLNYQPLAELPGDETLAMYKADHPDQAASSDESSVLSGPHPWLRRYRLDTFARANWLNYASSVDAARFGGAGFYHKDSVFESSVFDVLTTSDGQVTVASSSLYGPSASREGDLFKFAKIFVGSRAVSFKLEPRLSPDKRAADDLERHFYVRIEGAGLAAAMDKDAMTQLAVQTVATRKLSPEQRQSLPPELRAAAEQEAKKGWWARRKARIERRKALSALIDQADDRLSARLFPAPLRQLILTEALGWTLELHKNWLYVYRTLSHDLDDLIKPEVMQQTFRLAALLGPAVSEATAGLGRNR